jgi:DNA mismatch repair protein MutS
VARLAGVPERVTRRAATLLAELEAQRASAVDGTSGDAHCRAVCAELGALDPMTLSPLEALAELVRLQRLARGD